MQEAQIREWLDMLIINMQDMKSLESFNSEIMVCGARDYIHIHEGIEVVAEAVGGELREEPNDPSGEYKTKLTFKYKDVEVFQLVGDKNARTD